MKKSIYFVICFFPILLAGQNHQMISYHDGPDEIPIHSNNELTKDSELKIYRGADQPQLEFPKEGKIAEGTLKDGQKVGEWTFYYKDGETPKSKGNYIAGAPSGKFVKFHPNGIVKETGAIKKGSYYGEIKRFDTDGTLLYQAQYNSNGREEDTVYYYHKTGQPELIYYAQNGKPKGQALRFTKYGDLKSVIWYNQNGEVREQFSIKAGERGQDYHTSISRLMCLDRQKEATRIK